MAFKAVWNFLPCRSAVANLVSMPLIAVAATSGRLPKEINALASDAVCSSVSPNCFATPPTRSSELIIFSALAGLLLDKWLMASPNLPIWAIGISYTFASFAMLSPASSAAISKATDILDTVSVKLAISLRAIPRRPPEAAICANSLPAIGMRCVICSRSSPICLNCCGVSKSTTLRTSAMLVSKSIATLIGIMTVPTDAITPMTSLRIFSRLPRSSSNRVWMADCLMLKWRNRRVLSHNAA